MLLQQYVELRDMKDVSLNYSTFSESDKDNAYENISPLLEKNMLQLAANFYLIVIHMVQKMVGPGCCILAADWNCRMEMAEAVFVETTLHFTNTSNSIIVKSNSMNVFMMQAGRCGDSAPRCHNRCDTSMGISLPAVHCSALTASIQSRPHSPLCLSASSCHGFALSGSSHRTDLFE